VRLQLQVQPRASRTEVAGPHGGALRIRLAAPPVDGEANAELVAFLAKRLRVPKAAVTIVRGESGRRKVVEVAGVSAGDAAAALGV
jgi:hypothetical protein